MFRFFAWLKSLFTSSSEARFPPPPTPLPTVTITSTRDAGPDVTVIVPPPNIDPPPTPTYVTDGPTPAPTVRVTAYPVVGGKPIPYDSASYGTPDANGYCTVKEVEEMRAEINALDPSYNLAKYYLCPAVVNGIGDAKKRIMAQWACSQAAYWNMSAFQGGDNPFYPGVVVTSTVRPGQEEDVDTNPLKWVTVKGPFLSEGSCGVADMAGRPIVNAECGDYLIVSSIPHPGMELYTGVGIAAAVRKRWQESRRRRNGSVSA